MTSTLNTKGKITGWFKPVQITDNDTEEVDKGKSPAPEIQPSDGSSSSPDNASASAVPSKKRKSGFDDSWREIYPWVLQTADGMLCKLCKLYKVKAKSGSGVWTVVPCCSLFKQSLDRHKASAMHKTAEGMAVGAKLAEENGGVIAALNQQVNIKKTALLTALRLLYWLAKEEIAHTTKFTSLLKLVQQCGVTHLEHLRVGDNAIYQSESALQEMLESLAKVTRREVYQGMQNSPFYSILCDETTDVAVLNQLIFYGRFLDEQGQVQTRFLSIRDIRDGTAQTVTNSIKQFMDENNLDRSKFVGFGSDGASVMVGSRTGVATRLKEESPNLINIHCVAHRLALASAQAAHGISYLMKFKVNLSSLFSFYSRSAVRSAALHEIQHVMKDPILKVAQASDVRWLSHQKAVDTVRRSLPSLLVSLEREAAERGDPKAVGLLSFMKSYKYAATVSMLSDVLPHLTRLSLIFQKSNVDFSIVDTVVNATRCAVENLQDHHGQHMRALPEFVQSLSEHGATASLNAPEQFIDQVYNPYLKNVLTNLQERFPDTGLMKSFSCFDLISTDAETALTNTSDLQELCRHYHDLVEEEAAVQEWELLVPLLTSKSADTSYKESLRFIAKETELLPNLSKLASIALVLPVSTADCERGFSTMKRVKTNSRNRLAESTLLNLLTIAIEGADGAIFDFEKAATIWSQRKKRRLEI